MTYQKMVVVKWQKLLEEQNIDLNVFRKMFRTFVLPGSISVCLFNQILSK